MSGKFALIIANTEYTDAGLAQLTAPGKDAEDFGRVLRDPDLCGFDQVNILLNEPSFVIGEAIDEFFDQKTPDDLLVLYFSGHGVRDDVGALYLAVKNTNRVRLRATAIRSDYIREAMDQSRSKRQVLILDCCNSGAFAQGTKAEIGGVMGLRTAFQGYGHFTLMASDATQFAWEGDRVIGETQNSLFTHFLVKGLKGEADKDGDGKITVDELYDYTYDEIAQLTPKQTPTKAASKVAGEIVLRQITRMEEITAIPLPRELRDAIENPFADVRLGAVQQLMKLLNGKNLGMARSAKEALQDLAQNDDSRQVSAAASHALESIRQAEEAGKEAEQTERLNAEESRLAREKSESERKAREETERLLRAKAARETAEREATRQKLEKEAEERAARNKAALEAAQRAEAERKAREEAQRQRQTEGKTKANPKSTRTLIALIGGFLSILVCCSVGYYAMGVFLAAPTSPVSTATAIANATSTARIELTNTAVAKSTKTALVEALNTSVASTSTANAVNISQSRDGFMTALNTAAQLAYGPLDGSLKHNPDEATVHNNVAGVTLKDFIVTATFLNPYAATTNKWDYGFLLRQEGHNKQYRLILTSGKSWSLRNYVGTAEGVIIQKGELSNFDTNKDASNSVWIYCLGDRGMLYVNGDFIADLDLSARTTAGDISISTGMFTGDEVKGASTDYRDFAIRSLPLGYGPVSGSLKHNADDSSVALADSNTKLKNFVVKAVLTNPYSTATGSWDYGFLFRDEYGDKQYRLYITSAKTWTLQNNTGQGVGVVIAKGSVPGLNTSEDGSNTLLLYCLDGRGLLYVNGNFITGLDLSARQNAGVLRLATGIVTGDELNGSSTAYADFTVWKLP